MFIDVSSTSDLSKAEAVLPQTNTLKTTLSDYISETPVSDFIYQYLSKELHEFQEYDASAPALKLSELDGYGDLTALSHRLVGEFESLPWDYTLTIPLPRDIGSFLGRTIKFFPLSDAIAIVTPDEAFSGKFPLASGIPTRDRKISRSLGKWPGLLLTGESPNWEVQTAHLQIRVKGFVGEYGTTTTIREGIDIAKAFFGICIALRLFAIEHIYRQDPSKAQFYVHRKVSDKWVVERTSEMDAPQTEVFHDLILHTLDGRLTTDLEKEAWARETLAKIGGTFSIVEKSRRILLAGQWLFDSYCGSNELLSFVQAAVVMEILLGDKAVSDLLGLGELLRNRCAYLISTSHEERETLLSDFREIYAVRSSIVHAGKKRLNAKEWELFSKLRWMCRRVIQEEVKLLKD